MLLIVGGAIGLVLLLGAGYLLFRFQSSYQKINAERKAAMDKLDRLNRNDPFPSATNVALAAANKEALARYLESVQEELQRDQGEPEKIEPAEFAPRMERRIQQLRAHALMAGVTIPERTSLGFDRYAQGELPSMDAIPRLQVQAKTIETLLELLISVKVDEIVDIRRDVFEEAQVEPVEGAPVDRRFVAAVPTGSTEPSTGMAPPEENDLYTAERIFLTFVTREHGAWEVLNRLASSKMFAVVSHVEIRNEKPVASSGPSPLPGAPPGFAEPVGLPGAGLVAPTAYRSHEERIAGGREPVRVDLAVDVYRFVGEAKPEGSP